MKENYLKVSMLVYSIVSISQVIIFIFVMNNMLVVVIGNIILLLLFVLMYQIIKKINLVNKKVIANLNNENTIMQEKLENIKTDNAATIQKNKEKYESLQSDTGHTITTYYNELIVYKKSISMLIRSITSNLSSTTTPIANDLLKLQEKIVTFVHNISEYHDEIVKKTSLNKIVAKSEEIKSDSISVSEIIGETFTTFDKNLRLFETIINRIFENTGNIEEIANKVNVLSINAAIEAARSGDNGKGFSVISTEIKKLSGYTFNFLKEISNTIEESKNILKDINVSFATRERTIIELVGKQSSSNQELYSVFLAFDKNFETLYNQIQLFIEVIKVNIKNISPVIQLHEITIQEAENLDLAISDFIDNSLQILNPYITSDTIQTDHASEVIYRIRNRLTTSRELDALESVVKELNLDSKIDLKRQNNLIELF